MALAWKDHDTIEDNAVVQEISISSLTSEIEFYSNQSKLQTAAASSAMAAATDFAAKASEKQAILDAYLAVGVRPKKK